MENPQNYVHNNNLHSVSNKTTSPHQRSILPIINKKQDIQKNKLIEYYLQHNLTNSSSMTLKSGVVSIDYMGDSNYIGEVSDKSQLDQKNVSCESQRKQNLSELHKQGRGIYRYSNSDIYMGDWQADAFHGLGMYIFSNGNIYKGLFHHGSSIKGILNYANGQIYQGEFKDGLRHGKGMMKYVTKELDKEQQSFWVYTGEWWKDQRNGRGVLQSKEIIIEGIWEQDNINGQVFIKMNQSEQTNNISLQYKGLMSHDLFVKGFLKVRYWENNYYEGEVYQGQFQGKGKYAQLIKIEDQNYILYEYEGQFKNGCIMGKGRLKAVKRNIMMKHFKFISQYEGLFKTIDKNIPRFDSKGKIIYSNGDSYEGIFNLGLKNGHGMYKFQNGDIYEGDFKNDKINGRGVYKWSNATINYKGLFSNGAIVEGSGNFNQQQIMVNLNRHGLERTHQVSMQNCQAYVAPRIIYPQMIKRYAKMINRENQSLMNKSHGYINVMSHQLNNLNRI